MWPVALEAGRRDGLRPRGAQRSTSWTREFSCAAGSRRLIDAKGPGNAIDAAASCRLGVRIEQMSLARRLVRRRCAVSIVASSGILGHGCQKSEGWQCSSLCSQHAIIQPERDRSAVRRRVPLVAGCANYRGREMGSRTRFWQHPGPRQSVQVAIEIPGFTIRNRQQSLRERPTRQLSNIAAVAGNRRYMYSPSSMSVDAAANCQSGRGGCALPSGLRQLRYLF